MFEPNDDALWAKIRRTIEAFLFNEWRKGALFGLTPARLERAASDVIVMHPGPMNRGVEIDSEVADGPWSVILDQVANGVAVRMAVLYLLAGGEAEEGS